MIDPSDKRVLEETIRISEYQQQLEITEQISTGTDALGRPTFKVITRKPTQAQAQEEQKKEEAKEKADF